MGCKKLSYYEQKTSPLKVIHARAPVNTTTTNTKELFSFIGKSSIGANPEQEKKYVKADHLGNVRVVVSDLKKPTDDGTYVAGVKQNNTPDGVVDFYQADIVSAQDYYAFGSLMPGRNFNSTESRYGFNGKENDNEIKGTGNVQDYGMRMYDTRLGRFFSADPLIVKDQQYPELSPYQFASNTPIRSVDLDGLETAPPAQHLPFPALSLPKVGIPGPLGGFVWLIQVLNKPIDFDKLPKDNPLRKLHEEAMTKKANANLYEKQTDSQLKRSQQTYKDLIKEHEEKLDKFESDPEGESDPEKLKEVKKNAPDKVKQFFEGRIKSLKDQIKKQKGELEKIDKELKKRETK